MAVFPDVSFAHGGGLDASGCHNDRKRGGYHCHRGSSPPPRARQPVRAYAIPIRNIYANCAEARSAGVAPLRAGERGYAAHLDRDGDGVACESGSGSTVRAPVIVSPVRVVTKPSASVAAGQARLPIPIVGLGQVIDGDTIQIGLERIRLFGIDAFEPEQKCTQADGDAYGCGGRSSRALDERILGHTLTCMPRGKDAYQRQLAVCRAESDDLSSWLVRQGHALAYTKYAYDYVGDEKFAESKKVGAWGGTFEPPWEFRAGRTGGIAESLRVPVAPSANCVIKGNVSKNGRRIYHLPSDPFYTRTKPENWFCSTEEAQRAGFVRANTD